MNVFSALVCILIIMYPRFMHFISFQLSHINECQHFRSILILNLKKTMIKTNQEMEKPKMSSPTRALLKKRTELIEKNTPENRQHM